MEKKYELLNDDVKTIGSEKTYRIRALKDFLDVKNGDLGGYIAKEENLSHDGNAWVYGNACVYGDAQVYGDAWVYDNARVCGNACVYGDAWVYDDACVCDSAQVCGNACVCGAADYMYIKGIGSQFCGSTAYRAKDDGIGIVCGCFSGNLDEFEQKVRQTHGENKFAQEYQLFIEIIKLHFGECERGKQDGKENNGGNGEGDCTTAKRD